MWTVTRTAIAAVLAIGLLCMVVVLSVSFARVSDDEICQIFYPDGSRLITQTKPSLVFIGPGYEKHCVPRHTLHLKFESTASEGLDRVINARTSEGLPLDLSLDVEYRFTPAGLATSMKRVGFENYDQRLYMAARAEVRNVASRFPVSAFLRGTRQDIATTMRDSIAETIVEKDGILIEVIRVNLLSIQVYSSFEAKFQEVEDIVLEQIEAEASHKLAMVEETRLNETDIISVLAEREKLKEMGNAEVIEAQLQQSAQVTAAKTAAIRAQIQAESTRAQAIIRKQTQLEEVIADRDIEVAKAERQVVATMKLAETNRVGMEIEMQGLLRRAVANRTRDISIALLNQTQRLEGLTALEIDHNLDIFQRQLQANVTAQQQRNQGDAAAEAAFVETRSATDAHLALQIALNMTDAQLASLLWHRALKHAGTNSNRTVFLDYDKVALLSEFGTTDAEARANVDVSSTP